MTTADTVSAVDQLHWLAAQGAKFALPRGRTKGTDEQGKSTFEKGWQEKPHTLEEAVEHAKRGGNVGLLTGARSGGLVAIDRDVGWVDTLQLFGLEANTVRDERENASDRGKLLYRCVGELPPSRAWKPKGEKHPHAEMLSDGRHALIPPSIYNGGRYLLTNLDAGVRSTTLATLNGLWFMVTGEFLTPQEPNEADRDAPQDWRDYVARVKAAWTPEAVFRHFGKAGNGTSEVKGEVRILGNAGLLVKGDLWYCHGDSVGGDVIDAWHYCLHDSRLPRGDKRAFWDVIEDMGSGAGIVKPATRTKGSGASTATGTGTKDAGASFDGGKHDLGNAQFALDRYAGKFAYSDSLGWLHYTGSHWATDTAEAKVHAATVDALKARCALALQQNDLDLLKAATPTARHTRDALYHFRHMVTVPTGTFDAEKHLLNCQNGVVDLRTGELVTHDPSNRFTYCVPTAYKPGERSELWENLLLDWFQGDHEVMLYLQRAMGYTITGESREECMFYAYGPGRAGKGTLVNSIAALLGSQLARGVQFDAFTNAGDVQNFRLAPLRAARMVTASESKRGERLNEAILKQATGRDAIQVAHKYGQPFDLIPQFKLWLMSNEPPRGDVDDDAFWDRVRLFTFEKSHMGTADNGLKDRLMQQAHREGVLAWLIHGSMRWYERGLGAPSKLTAATEAVRQEQDHVHQWLLDRCEKRDIETTTADLYASYSDWCNEAGIDKAKLSKMGLTQRLEKKGYTVRRTTLQGVQVRLVYGVSIT